MMGRVTPGFRHNDFLQGLQTRNEAFQKEQKKLTTGIKVLLPSDDPANTINFMEWEGKQADLTKFNEIIGSYKNKLNIVDGHLDAVTSSLHRIRELTVQAANGTFTKDDREIMAMEMDQLIRQIVSDANTEYRGNPLFSGTSTTSQPYRMTENYDLNTKMSIITDIDYFGNAQEKVMDIGQKDRISSVAAGSTIFETTRTIIQGTNNISGYVVGQDTKIMIEGEEINILVGDNIETISQKINDAKLSVQANIETLANGESHFRLASISARKPWLQDIAGGTVLQDLGVIDNGIEGPKNYSPTATVTNSSIFDTLIRVRDSLLANEVTEIGSEDLGSIDQSLNNILRYRTYTGAVVERLEKTFARNETEAMYLADSASNAVNTDYTKTITDLKMAEFAHQAALNIGAKLLPTTLMDFLR